jgi:hypothetical protein
MTDDEKPRFLRTLVALAALKPGKEQTPESLELFWRAMRDKWALAEFEAAAAHLSESCEFMPNPYHFAQLRKQAGEQACGDAWAAVVQVNRYSRIGREHLVTPRIERIVAAMGGWSALAMTRTEELPFREKRFKELWEEFGETEEARAALPHIAEPKQVRAIDGLVKQLVKRA